MRANVWTVGVTNAVVLLAASSIAVGEHLTRHDHRAPVAAPAAQQGAPPWERPRHGGDADGTVAAIHARSAAPPAAADHEAEGSGEGAHDAEPGVDGPAEPQPAQPVEPEMGWSAQVVAACESGLRHADGLPVLGSHRWHIDNHHGGTDSGAFQFVDATWRRVAAEIGASQFARAKHAPPQVQLDAFRWLWGRDPGSWNASRSCWGPALGG